ncbi:VTT domain-containing protein [Candidatus Uhrbacteria bacterium]|nr:VTT domain-containing protein [Candidatus Uhrbacteria bacterium]
MNLIELITATGYVGVAATIFAESGLLVGIFLPGDSLLFTAGFLASIGVFDVRVLIVLGVIAAVAGDSVGYLFGQRLGPRIFSRPDSLVFNRAHVQRAQQFYEKHGPKTIVLARFTPIVRTFAPILAGVGRMAYRKFLLYNIVGGVMWAAGLPLLGYWLGSVIPNIDQYLLPIVAGIIVISLSPSIVHLLRDPAFRTRLAQLVRSCTERVMCARSRGRAPLDRNG